MTERLPYQHDLKVTIEFFPALEDNSKGFELRIDDRYYEVGDVLNLREWNAPIGEYTGRAVRRTVTYILRGSQAERFGLRPGYCVMSLRPATATDLYPANDEHP